jgi:hypothetical protein
MEKPTNEKIETIIQALKDNIQAISIYSGSHHSKNINDRKKVIFDICMSCLLYVDGLDWIIKNELTTKKENKNDNK